MRNFRPTYQRFLFHTAKKKLNVLSTSSIYAILSVISPLLKALNFEKDVMVITSLHLLSELVSLAFFVPAKETDGFYAINYGNNPLKVQ